MFYIKNILAIVLAVAFGLTTAVPFGWAQAADVPEFSESTWASVSRVIVIPDIHGAYQAFVQLLQATGVVDADLHWVGGKAHLVSLGDLLDRGGDSRPVMDLLMRLQEEAPAAGGRVHVVLGNHEQMNLVGDLRYVSKGEFAAFAIDETAEMRDEAFIGFAAAKPDLTVEQARAAFAERYPAGYFAHREAFRSDGRYGKWLLSLPTIIVINNTALVHGGLPGTTANWTAGQLNSDFNRDLRRYLEVWQELVAAGVLPADDPDSALEVVTDVLDAYPSNCVEERAFACRQIEGNGAIQTLMEEFSLLSGAAVNGFDSPFWYRGSVYCRDILERPVLDEYLHTLGAERVIVGHTPTADRRMRSIREGKVIMTDTGMLASYYSGRPAALVMQDGKLLVQYLEPPQQSALLDGVGPVAYGLEQAALEQALAEGAVSAVDKSKGGVFWRVTLDYQGKQIAARFFPGGRRGTANAELAAYALDRMLGTELVAAVVSRSIDDTDGALQLVYPGEISEQERLEARLGFTGWCPMADQFQLMNAFDLLIANPGRSSGNILYTRSDWTLRLSEHGFAFSSSARLPSALGDDAITLPPGLVTALAKLDHARLKTALGDYLDNKSIRALLARRDEILQKFGN